MSSTTKIENGRWIDNMLIQGVKDGNHLRVVQTLRAGASVDARDSDGVPALTLAVFHRHAAICGLLIVEGADLHARERKVDLTPMHRVAAAGMVEVCELMLDKGGDPNVRSEEYGTPLHQAARPFDGPEMIGLLLSRGALVDAQNSLKQTPLLNAVAQNEFESALVLLRAGADINHVDYRGSTPFKFAEENVRDKMCRFLIAHGADASENPVWKKMTMLEAAASGGFAGRMTELMAADPSADLAHLRKMAMFCGERETAAILDSEMARLAISSIAIKAGRSMTP